MDSGPASPEVASLASHDRLGALPRTNVVWVRPLILITGGVLAMLTPFTDAGTLAFPAISSAAPLASWLAPSVLSVTGSEHVATPDPLAPLEALGSSQLNFIVTGPLYQPLPLLEVFGPGSTLVTAVGLVLSIL